VQLRETLSALWVQWEEEEMSLNRLADALRHPVALAAATALFSGVIATGVIRVWQNHDKSLEIQRVQAEQELDLKSRLVREIGATSAGFVGMS
jgi:uncharacterized membrane-anchored protein